MTYSRVLFIAAFLILSGIQSQFIQAQDSVKVVSLTRAIGPVIDSAERNKYNYFPNEGKRFNSAFFFMDTDSLYYCIITKNSNGSVIDSIAYYPSLIVHSMAAKAVYYETGKRMNPADIELFFSDTVITKPPSFKPAVVHRTEVKNSGKDQIPLDHPIKSFKRNLPLAENKIDAAGLIQDEIRIYLGIGGIYKTSGILGINRLFNLFEAELPAPGYSLEFSHSDYNPGIMLTITTMAIFRNFLLAEARLNTRTGSESMSYLSLRFSAGYLFTLRENLNPYLSAGFTKVYFDVKRNYGKEIQPQFYPLEYISITGRSSGLDITAGLLYKLSDVVSLNLSGGYKFLSHPSLDISPGEKIVDPDYDKTTNASGFETSITFMVN